MTPTDSILRGRSPRRVLETAGLEPELPSHNSEDDRLSPSFSGAWLRRDLPPRFRKGAGALLRKVFVASADPRHRLLVDASVYRKFPGLAVLSIHSDYDGSGHSPRPEEFNPDKANRLFILSILEFVRKYGAEFGVTNVLVRYNGRDANDAWVADALQPHGFVRDEVPYEVQEAASMGGHFIGPTRLDLAYFKVPDAGR